MFQRRAIGFWYDIDWGNFEEMVVRRIYYNGSGGQVITTGGRTGLKLPYDYEPSIETARQVLLFINHLEFPSDRDENGMPRISEYEGNFIVFYPNPKITDEVEIIWF